MEDDLKKKKMEDDLKKKYKKKWRRPKFYFYFLMEGDPQQIMQPKASKSK